jgi:hypothetical protein
VKEKAERSELCNKRTDVLLLVLTRRKGTTSQGMQVACQMLVKTRKRILSYKLQKGMQPF